MEFVPEENGTLTLESAVYQAIGAASVCWKGGPSGVFDTDKAKEVAEALLDFIKEHESPNLGLATTRELLDEITTRIDMDWHLGGGGLDYSTVGGRPDIQIESMDEINRLAFRLSIVYPGEQIRQIRALRDVYPLSLKDAKAITDKFKKGSISNESSKG